MSDGPYREQSLLGTYVPQPVVPADESATPSNRLEVTDYDDGSTRVVLLRRMTMFYGPFAIAGVATASFGHWQSSLLPLAMSALGFLYTRILSRRATELSVVSRSVIWRAETRGTALLDDVCSFQTGPGREIRIILKSGKVETTLRRPIIPQMQAALSDDELAWLAGRLNRALERVRR